MEIGEAVSIEDFRGVELHDEATCPWHTKRDSQARPMEKEDPDTDSEGAMPPNNGGTLGRNLIDAKEVPPAANSVPLYFEKIEVVKYATKKTVQVYSRTVSSQDFPLQYAPHHLIPGNESLKGSAVVPYMGDDACIEEYAEGQASVIKTGCSIGYDVNAAENGAWLPSPYALSNKNDWPAIPGIKYLKKRKGEEVGQQTEDFKSAYVAAAIHASGERQFHMRHQMYSKKVFDLLDAIGQRLKKMSKGACPLAARDEKDKKSDPPMGLVSRLHVLSANLRGLVAGPVWRAPLYADGLTQAYAEDLVAKFGKTTKTVNILKVL